MKRLSILSVILLFLFACEGDIGPMGPPGEPGKGTNWTIVEYTFSPDDWVLEGDGVDALNSSWVASYSIPDDIEGFYYEDGVIVVYCYPEGRGRIKVPLPYVKHYAKDPGEEYEDFWTETLHYTIDEDQIYFYLTYSDFAINVGPTEALGNMDIDVVLLWE